METKRTLKQKVFDMQPDMENLGSNVIPYGKYAGCRLEQLSTGAIKAIYGAWNGGPLRRSQLFKAIGIYLEHRNLEKALKFSDRYELGDSGLLTFEAVDNQEMEDDCPFDWNPASANCFHVSRWQGEHQDGPNCTHERRGGTLVLKEEFAGMANRRQESSLLNEEVMFGKHKGKTWRTVPKEYCEWLLQTFEDNKKNRRSRACANARLKLS